MRELWATIAQTSATKIYGLAIGIVVLFLTARWLGPDGRGLVATITTWVGLFATLGGMSVGQVALHRLGGEEGRSRLGEVLGSLLVLVLLVTIAAWVVAAFMAAAGERGLFRGLPDFALSIGFLILPLVVWEQYGGVVLMALEKLRVYNLLELVGRTAILLCVVVLVALMDAGVAGVLLAMLTGQAIVSAGGLSYLIAEARKRGQAIGPHRNELAALLSGGAKLHLNAVGTLLFTSAGILILSHYRGPSETAYYQLALQLMGAILIVPQAASMTMYGKITKLGPNAGWPMHRRVLWQILACISILCVVAGVSAPLWVAALAGEPFRPAIVVFQWMLFGTIGMAFSTLMAAQWIGRGYFLQASLVTLGGGVLSLAMNLILVPEHGAMGAVHAYLITAGYSVIVNGVFAIHCSRQSLAS